MESFLASKLVRPRPGFDMLALLIFVARVAGGNDLVRSQIIHCRRGSVPVVNVFVLYEAIRDRSEVDLFESLRLNIQLNKRRHVPRNRAHRSVAVAESNRLLALLQMLAHLQQLLNWTAAFWNLHFSKSW